MFGNFYKTFGDSGMYSWNNAFGLGFGTGFFLAPFFVLIILWTLYWKYKALWHAARHDRKWWFIALLVINTVGILDILYLYVFSKKSKSVER